MGFISSAHRLHSSSGSSDSRHCVCCGDLEESRRAGSRRYRNLRRCASQGIEQDSTRFLSVILHRSSVAIVVRDLVFQPSPARTRFSNQETLPNQTPTAGDRCSTPRPDECLARRQPSESQNAYEFERGRLHVGVHSENVRRSLVRSERQLARKNSKRVQTGELNIETPGWIRKLSIVRGLFVGNGRAQAKKTLKLVKLSNSFFMHAIHVGYQRRELVPTHQCNRRTAKQVSKCQQFGQARYEVGRDNCWSSLSRRSHLA